MAPHPRPVDPVVESPLETVWRVRDAGRLFVGQNLVAASADEALIRGDDGQIVSLCACGEKPVGGIALGQRYLFCCEHDFMGDCGLPERDLRKSGCYPARAVRMEHEPLLFAQNENLPRADGRNPDFFRGSLAAV